MDGTTTSSRSTGTVAHHAGQGADVGRSRWLTIIWALTRLAIGWIFLWAFLDKLFGLGYSTPKENAWLDGGSPTAGFLSNAATGPFESFYQGIAGDAWADWAFMLGLAGIGVGLILGVLYRIASVGAVVLLVLMWTVVLPPENNPIIDDHIVQALVLIGLMLAGAEDTLGLGRWWGRVVRGNAILK
jgi:thiosulfate dehydrogenase [quinone] large subunit